jgi:hypothetical protein
MSVSNRAFVALEREFPAPHLVKGAEGPEGRPHLHRYRVSVSVLGDPDMADIAQLLDDAIRAVHTAAFDQSASPTSMAYWFREHLVFAVPRCVVQLVRYDPSGDVRVTVPAL